MGKVAEYDELSPYVRRVREVPVGAQDTQTEEYRFEGWMGLAKKMRERKEGILDERGRKCAWRGRSQDLIERVQDGRIGGFKEGYTQRFNLKGISIKYRLTQTVPC